MSAETARYGRTHPSSFIPHPFLLLLALLLTACRPPEPPPKPNILLITLDTFRADRLGANTPNLVALAERSVRFDRAESAVPLTLPSHATILSGVLPMHHGVRNNGAGAFPANRDTLATVLSRGGWRTGAFVSSFVLDHRFGLARGFDVYDDAVERSGEESANTYEAERLGGETVDRALAWLHQSDARPFFAWVHLYDPHAPYAPPAPYPQTYDGEVRYVDAQVGRLLAAVDAKTTIVAIIGDHGEALGEHGELTHGLLLYEPTLHVPLAISGPGIKARHVSEAVGSKDLAPTLAALAGVALAGTDGRSLAEEIRNGRDPKPDALYAETEYPTTFGWSDLTAMRRDQKKLIRGTSAELFDLAHDPGETKNILTDERRAYHDLAAMLDSAKASAIIVKPSAVDDETKAKLASLGYVAPGTTPVSGSHEDPRAMAPLFRRYETAVWALNDKKNAEAVATLESLLHDDPHNSVFRGTLARAYRQAGQLDRAVALYREAVALAPESVDAWYELGAALQTAGRKREAGVVIAEAIRRDPARPEAHNTLGIAYAADGKFAEAEAEFRKVIDIDPRNARAYNNLGNIMREQNRPDDATRFYQQAVAISPRYPDPFNGLGVIEVQRDRPREAIPHFDAALQAAPDFYEAQLNRGIALQMAGEKDAAAEQFKRLLQALPKRAEYDSQRQAATALLARLSRS